MIDNILELRIIVNGKEYSKGLKLTKGINREQIKEILNRLGESYTNKKTLG